MSQQLWLTTSKRGCCKYIICFEYRVTQRTTKGVRYILDHTRFGICSVYLNLYLKLKRNSTAQITTVIQTTKRLQIKENHTIDRLSNDGTFIYYSGSEHMTTERFHSNLFKIVSTLRVNFTVFNYMNTLIPPTKRVSHKPYIS